MLPQGEKSTAPGLLCKAAKQGSAAGWPRPRALTANPALDLLADRGTDHNRAVFMAYRARIGPHGESYMRFILGIIIGCALTAGGAYIVDSTAPTAADKMVNWEAVKKNIDTATTLAREGWKKIAG